MKKKKSDFVDDANTSTMRWLIIIIIYPCVLERRQRYALHRSQDDDDDDDNWEECDDNTMKYKRKIILKRVLCRICEMASASESKSAFYDGFNALLTNQYCLPYYSFTTFLTNKWLPICNHERCNRKQEWNKKNILQSKNGVSAEKWHKMVVKKKENRKLSNIKLRSTLCLQKCLRMILVCHPHPSHRFNVHKNDVIYHAAITIDSSMFSIVKPEPDDMAECTQYIYIYV